MLFTNQNRRIGDNYNRGRIIENLTKRNHYMATNISGITEKRAASTTNSGFIDVRTQQNVAEKPILIAANTYVAGKGTNTKLIQAPANIQPTIAAPQKRPLLRVGARDTQAQGGPVWQMKTLLNRHGYKIRVNGFFGDTTSLRTIRQFQLDHGLKPDGVVGANTWRVLAGPVTPTPTTSIKDSRLRAHGITAGILQPSAYVPRLEDSLNMKPSTRPIITLMQETLYRECERRGYAERSWDDYGSGMSLGFAQFNQKWGALGELLQMAYDHDPERLVGHFYGDLKGNANPRKLLKEWIDEMNHSDMAIRMGEKNSGAKRTEDMYMLKSKGVRTLKPHWIKRFERFLADNEFYFLQDKLAYKKYFKPVHTAAREFGVTSERSYALLFDICINRGDTAMDNALKRAFQKNPLLVRVLNDKNEPLKTRMLAERALMVRVAQESIAGYEKEDYYASWVKRRSRILASPVLSDAPDVIARDAPNFTDPTIKRRNTPRFDDPFAPPLTKAVLDAAALATQALA